MIGLKRESKRSHLMQIAVSSKGFLAAADDSGDVKVKYCVDINVEDKHACIILKHIK